MEAPVADLLDFLDASPSPYHAVAESVRRLSAEGYSSLDEGERWTLAAGDRRFVVRGDGSIAAFEVGSDAPESAGFRIVGAHTDSPNLRVKPVPDRSAHGYHQLTVEPYGGVLLYTWFDRDLSLAGRVRVGTSTVLVDFARPMLRVPSLAIHLQRELREQGLRLNEQRHLAPIAGLGSSTELAEMLAGEISRSNGRAVTAAQIDAFELMTYDVQPASLAGTDDELIAGGRIDNLASCHGALCALLAAGRQGPSKATRVIVLYDHEEVGSRSAQGAGGPLLADTLERIATATGSDPQSTARAVSRSHMISADMAHAIHPNYADRHDHNHRPVIGGGPVIKSNANLSYASDATTAGLFASLCRRCDIVPQKFVVRSDMPCGSTIGPITAARVGIATVDVGNPMLAMHSCRETAGAADVEPMIEVLTAFFGDG